MSYPKIHHERLNGLTACGLPARFYLTDSSIDTNVVDCQTCLRSMKAHPPADDVVWAFVRGWSIDRCAREFSLKAKQVERAIREAL